jgi:nucleoside-diphosphate-sugar epimerase
MSIIEQSCQKLLVTGATGFLGRHVIQALSQDTAILALVRKKSDWHSYDWTKNLQNVTLIEGELTKTNWQENTALTGLQGIFHLAAIVHHSRTDAEESCHTNIDGTLSMVRLAAKHKCRLVFVSTSGTVGCFDTFAESADETAPYAEKKVARWPYYDSKVQAEKQARALAQKLGVDLVIIRPPVMLGPGDHRHRSTGVIISFLKKKIPFVLKGGIQFIDVRDAAQAMVTAMTLKNPQPVYHLCGTSCSLQDYFAMLEKASGVTPPKKCLPTGIAWCVAVLSKFIFSALNKKSPLPDPVLVEMASKYWATKSLYAKQDLHFVSRNPDRTLKDTVEWIRKYV